MKILMCGDVMARAGREAVSEHLPALRQSLGLDFVIVNGEKTIVNSKRKITHVFEKILKNGLLTPKDNLVAIRIPRN